MKKIAIIGIGGVGGYFGGKIAHALTNSKEHEVYFVARGKHLEVIKKEGLLLKTNQEGEFRCVPTLATDNIHDLPTLDICFICVKQYDLTPVLEQLRSKITPQTKVVPLLNGVDIYERIRNVVDDGIVFPACVYVGTHIAAPGIVEQSGGSCTIIFGTDPKHPHMDAKDICQLFDTSAIKYEWTAHHMEAIWEKFMFIASYGLVTACYNKTLGEVYASEEYAKSVKLIMETIYDISKAMKIGLGHDIVEQSYKKAALFPFETKTSFQRDYELKDKPDERELFGGSIIVLGKKYGIDVSAVQEIYQQLNEK